MYALTDHEDAGEHATAATTGCQGLSSRGKRFMNRSIMNEIMISHDDEDSFDADGNTQ